MKTALARDTGAENLAPSNWLSTQGNRLVSVGSVRTRRKITLWARLGPIQLSDEGRRPHLVSGPRRFARRQEPEVLPRSSLDGTPARTVPFRFCPHPSNEAGAISRPIHRLDR